MEDSGSFTDLTKFKRLMEVVRRNVVLSTGWSEDQFRKVASLAGGNIEFRTLPVLRYATINGQDVNTVDPAATKAEVAAAFDPPAESTTTAPDPATSADEQSDAEPAPDQGAPIDGEGIPCVN